MEGTRIRMMPEYSLEIPLWDDVNSRAVSDDTVSVKPLPDGWSADHERRGRRLFDRLQREIDPDFETAYRY